MRILCLPYTHTLSHVSRLLVVARVLRERGHEVIFAGAGPETKSHFIKKEGFATLPFYQINPNDLFGRIREGKMKFVTEDELEKMIQSDREVYREVRPDVVMADGRFSSMISAGIDNIPHAAIVNVSSTEYRALPYVPFFDWLPQSLAKNLYPLNLRLEMQLFDNVANSFKKWSKKHQLRRSVTATNCLCGNDLTLMADVEEYFPTRNLPGDYHYIGPLTWRQGMAPPAWWPPQTSGKSLIYITMGTTWVGGSFESLYHLIREHGLAAIITTGGQLKDAAGKGLETVPGEIYLEEFIAGEEAMKACDLVVCHGGNGTIYQALEQGRPIIGIPTIPDQDFNMRRVEALGVGIKIKPADLDKDPQALVAAIRKILDTPAYREKAAGFSRKLQGLKPADKAADLIERTFSKN
ncbi:glycosyltransferase [Geoalkalibacter halelectricus]|uniref:glycosyltransferase n=1 Tax=Geoalkalibacter halelectricus TaxID=2847045 RepID=UPI003D2238FA